MTNFSSLLFFVLFSSASFAQDSVMIPDIHSAEKIISIHFTGAKEDSLSGQVRDRAKEYDKMHRYSLDNSIPMTMAESPLLPYMILNKKQLPVNFTIPAGVNLPANKNDL